MWNLSIFLLSLYIYFVRMKAIVKTGLVILIALISLSLYNADSHYYELREQQLSSNSFTQGTITNQSFEITAYNTITDATILHATHNSNTFVRRINSGNSLISPKIFAPKDIIEYFTQKVVREHTGQLAIKGKPLSHYYVYALRKIRI